MNERVLIAGAGPVGCVAALALARQGVPVTVFEAAPAISTLSFIHHSPPSPPTRIGMSHHNTPAPATNLPDMIR